MIRKDHKLSVGGFPVDILAQAHSGVDMSNASSSHDRSPLPVGLVQTHLSPRVQAGDVSLCVDPPAANGNRNPNKKMRKSSNGSQQ